MGSSDRTTPPPIPGTQPAAPAIDTNALATAIATALGQTLAPMLQQGNAQVLQAVQAMAQRPLVAPTQVQRVHPLTASLSKLDAEDPMSPVLQALGATIVQLEQGQTMQRQTIERLQGDLGRRSDEERLSQLTGKHVPEKLGRLTDIAKIVALATKKAGLDVSEEDAMTRFLADVQATIEDQAEERANAKLQESLDARTLGMPGLHPGMGLQGLKITEKLDDAAYGERLNEIAMAASKLSQQDENFNVADFYARMVDGDGSPTQH